MQYHRPRMANNPYRVTDVVHGGDPRSDRCQKCLGPGPTKQVTFMRNIGVIVLRFSSTLSGRLCRNCIDQAFLTMWVPTLFFGWWGVISFVFTLIAVPTGLITYLGALSLPHPVPEPFNPTVGAPPVPLNPGITAPANAAYAGSASPSAFQGYGTAPTIAPKKSNTTLIIIGLLCVPVVLCCLSGTGVVIYGIFASQAMSAVSTACAGTGAPTAAVYVPGPGLHRIAGFEQNGGKWAADYDLVPDVWKTSDAETAELVLCVGEEQRNVLERCPYSVSGGSSILERVAFSREARLVVARTGQVLGGKTIDGTAPVACADFEAFTAAGSTTAREGGHVESMDFEPFLRPFATGQPVAR